MHTPTEVSEQCELLRAILNFVENNPKRSLKTITNDMNNRFRIEGLGSKPAFNNTLWPKAVNPEIKHKFAGETRSSLCALFRECYDLKWEKEGKVWMVRYATIAPLESNVASENPLFDDPNFRIVYTILLPNVKDDLRQNLIWSGILQVNPQFTQGRALYFEQDDKNPSQVFNVKLHNDPQAAVLVAECSITSGNRKKTSEDPFDFVFYLRKTAGHADLMYGYYTGRRQSLHLTCGEVIFQPVKDGGMADALKLMRQKAPMDLQMQLQHKFHLLPPLSEPRISLQAQKDIVALSPFVGFYKGCFVFEPTNELHEVYLSIFGNGTVSILTGLTSVESRGVIHVKSPSLFLFQFDFKKKTHRFPLLMAVAKGKLTEPVRIEGFFSGVTPNTDPFAGHVKVVLVDKDPNLLASAAPQGFNISEDELPNKLLKDWIREPKNKIFEFFLKEKSNLLKEQSNRLNKIVAATEFPKEENFGIEPGEYECFCLTTVETKNLLFWAQRLRLEVCEDLSIKLHTESGRIYQCNARRVLDSDVFVLDFIDFSFYLNLPHASTDPVLRPITGVYAGKSNVSVRPMGGRIKLIPWKERAGKPEPHNFELPRDLTLLENEHPGLIEYFLGKEDWMMESNRSLLKSGIVPRSATSPLELERIAGIYVSYKLNVTGKFFNLNHLCIFPNGNFLMKSTRGGGAAKYSGVANVYENLLSIRTHKFGDTPHFAQSLFRIWNLAGKDLMILRGVSIAVSGEQEPLAALEVLRYIGPPVTKELFENDPKYIPKSIPIPFGGTKYFEFDTADKECHGLLRYMLAPSTHLIKTATVHSLNFMEEEDSVSEAYFAAACYYSGLQTDSGKIKAGQFLEKARKEGFGKYAEQYSRLSNELVNGLLRPLLATFPLETFFNGVHSE